MTVAEIQLWLMGTSVLLSLSAMVVAYLGRRHKETEILGRRLDAVDERLKSIPAKEDVHSIEVALANLRGDIRVLTTSMAGHGEILKRVESVVGRHEDHLMQNGGRK